MNCFDWRDHIHLGPSHLANRPRNGHGVAWSGFPESGFVKSCEEKNMEDFLPFSYRFIENPWNIGRCSRDPPGPPPPPHRGRSVAPQPPRVPFPDLLPAAPREESHQLGYMGVQEMRESRGSIMIYGGFLSHFFFLVFPLEIKTSIYRGVQDFPLPHLITKGFTKFWDWLTVDWWSMDCLKGTS